MTLYRGKVTYYATFVYCRLAPKKESMVALLISFSRKRDMSSEVLSHVFDVFSCQVLNLLGFNIKITGIGKTVRGIKRTIGSFVFRLVKINRGY